MDWKQQAKLIFNVQKPGPLRLIIVTVVNVLSTIKPYWSSTSILSAFRSWGIRVGIRVAPDR